MLAARLLTGFPFRCKGDGRQRRDDRHWFARDLVSRRYFNAQTGEVFPSLVKLEELEPRAFRARGDYPVLEAFCCEVLNELLVDLTCMHGRGHDSDRDANDGDDQAPAQGPTHSAPFSLAGRFLRCEGLQVRRRLVR